MSLPLFLSAVPLIAWAHFAFVAEWLNPFTGPSAPLPRQRWRFARRLTVGGLFAVAVAAAWLVAGDVVPGGRVGALAVGACVYLSIGTVSWMAYRRRGRLWGPVDRDSFATRKDCDSGDLELPSFPPGAARSPIMGPVGTSFSSPGCAEKTDSTEAELLAKRLKSRPVDIVI